jgi:hypothetical protein
MGRLLCEQLLLLLLSGKFGWMTLAAADGLLVTLLATLLVTLLATLPVTLLCAGHG